MTTSFNVVKFIKTNLMPTLNKAIKTPFTSRYLLYTNVGLSLTLSGVGDIIEQQYEILTEDLESWDKTRTRNMSVCGMMIGIFCHHWYNFLDRRLPGYTLRTILKKIVIDQLICSPVCITTLFATSAVLERQSKEEFLKEFKQKSGVLYTAEWVVWPPAQFINFYFLPTRFRVLYDNMVSLGYDVYTSYVKNNSAEKDKCKNPCR